MKISELITKLQEVKEQYGDKDLVYYPEDSGFAATLDDIGVRVSEYDDISLLVERNEVPNTPDNYLVIDLL